MKNKKIIAVFTAVWCCFIFLSCDTTQPRVETDYELPAPKQVQASKDGDKTDDTKGVVKAGKWEISKEKLAIIQEYMKEKYNYTLTKEQEKEFIDYVLNKKLLAMEAKEKGYAERKDIKIKYEWDYEELISHAYYEDAVLKKSEVTESEARRYYDSNKAEFAEVSAAHILVKNRELAQNLIQRIKSGEKFEDIAMQYSEDETTKNSGGDLGFFGRGVMVEEFENAAFLLAPGEISSKPVQTLYGYHIIKVREKRNNSFDDSKEKIIKMLKEKRIKENFDALIKRLREKYGAGIIK